jgi:N-dimethylarginine dimethylaminohydrolase
MKPGSHSEVGRIRILLLKHPNDSHIDQNNIDGQWRELHYSNCPDFEKTRSEYESYLDILREYVDEFYFLPQNPATGLDSVYIRDPIVITEAGAILCNMGKEKRRTEPEIAGKFLSELGFPILGAIAGDGRLEGGDIIWLDNRTLVVGQGYRTNAEGIRQLKELTSGIVDDLVVVPLVHGDGPEECFHLMSFISPIGHDLAVVYSRFMPVPFREYLLSRGIRIVEVPDEEYMSMACNILAVAPDKCIMLSGNPITKRRLREAGAEVHEFAGGDICLKGAGGPTCLTRPLVRE